MYIAGCSVLFHHCYAISPHCVLKLLCTHSSISLLIMQSRRHTTEIDIEQLSGQSQGITRRNSSSTENLDMSLSQDICGHDALDQSSLSISQQFLSSSWNSLHGSEVGDLESEVPHYIASQADFNEVPLNEVSLGAPPTGHQYQLSYELALDNVLLTPLATTEAPPYSTVAFQSQRLTCSCSTTA